VSREAFEGGEFDWFAVDAAGHVGHFSTAGFGPVPLPILERLDAAQMDDLWSLGRRMLDLPVIGAASGQMPGRIDDWLALARRGLFGFDWKHWSGPYLRAATPGVPVTVANLSAELRRLASVVEFQELRFAQLEAIRPEAFYPCG
jgi:hypothetical protein